MIIQSTKMIPPYFWKNMSSRQCWMYSIFTFRIRQNYSVWKEC